MNVTKLGFKTKTRKGETIFRIKLDIPKILSDIEQGNVNQAIDIIADKAGNVGIFSANGSKGRYTDLRYYTWAMKPIEVSNE